MEVCGGDGKRIVINCCKAFTYGISYQVHQHLTFYTVLQMLRQFWEVCGVAMPRRKTSAMMKSYNKSALLHLKYQTMGHNFCYS